MATLTIIPYAPKPPKSNLRKPISKSIISQPSFLDENLRIDSSDVPISVPLALHGAAGNSNSWYPKVGGDSEATAQIVHSGGNDIVGARAASIPEVEDSSDDTDDESSSLIRLLSSKCKHILADEKPSVHCTVEKSADQALNNNRPSYSELTFPGSYDEPITLDSDNKLDNDDSDLYAKHTSHSLNSERQDNDGFNLENPHILPNYTVNAQDDHDIDIDNTKLLHPTKRQRSASPLCNSIFRHAGTPPLSYNEDWDGGRKNIDNSDRIELEDDDMYFKRQRLSDAPGGRNSLNRRNERLQRCPSPISEEDEDDRTLSSSANGEPAGTTRATPAYEPTPPTEPQLCLQVIDDDQDWEVRQIIGKEEVDGVLHYMVDWHPTLIPEESLGHAKELVDKFEARLQSQRRVKSGQRGPGLKRGERAVAKADAPSAERRRNREAGLRSKLEAGYPQPSQHTSSVADDLLLP